MSQPWSKPLDVERLAETEADVDFAIPLAELPALRSLRGGIAGSVGGRVHFAREQEIAVARLALSGTVMLECQRCVQPMQLQLDTAAQVALVGSVAEAARVPADLEPVLAEGGRISIGELVTEELLLVLPIVPLHTGGAECPPVPGAAVAQEETRGQTHQPFARLGELLKR